MTTEFQLHNPKLCSLHEAVEKRAELKNAGKSFVLTNGCFDLLHAGHLSYLRKARNLGDALWIALNGDQSVSSLKGPSRPILSEKERAYFLASMEFIDGIVIFNTPRLTPEILALKPDVYAKAGDYTLETLNPEERSALKKIGARIEFIPFLSGYSSTDMIQKIAKAAEAETERCE